MEEPGWANAQGIAEGENGGRPMSQIGERERQTQHEVLCYFQNDLGYRYLGAWKYRGDNSAIEEELLRDWLGQQGQGENIINKVLRKLGEEAALSDGKTLYDANRAVYGLLRYGVKVKPAVDAQTI